jgi:hypothetical protein
VNGEPGNQARCGDHGPRGPQGKRCNSDRRTPASRRLILL